MQRVHAVGIDVAGKVGRTPDAANGDHVVVWDLKIDQRLLYRGQHSKITASGAPIGIDLAFQVGHRYVLGIG